jgi:hypothetical protein
MYESYGPNGAISRFHNPDNYTKGLQRLPEMVLKADFGGDHTAVATGRSTSCSYYVRKVGGTSWSDEGRHCFEEINFSREELMAAPSGGMASRMEY